jgi:hypothetical protein
MSSLHETGTSFTTATTTLPTPTNAHATSFFSTPLLLIFVFPLNNGKWLISTHTHPIDKNGVPKEAQDNALSNGISADRQIPP